MKKEGNVLETGEDETLTSDTTSYTCCFSTKSCWFVA